MTMKLNVTLTILGDKAIIIAGSYSDYLFTANIWVGKNTDNKRKLLKDLALELTNKKQLEVHSVEPLEVHNTTHATHQFYGAKVGDFDVAISMTI